MKWVARILTIVLVVALVGLIVAWTQFDRAAKAALVDGVESAGEVACEVKGLRVSLLRGRMNVREMAVKNPPAYSDADMLNLKNAVLDVRVASLTDRPVEVAKMEIAEPHLRLEKNEDGSNVKVFLSNVKRNTAADKAPEAVDEKAAEQKKPALLVIDKLVIKDAKVELGPGFKGVGKVIDLPTIELTDLRGPDGRGITTANLTSRIIERMADGAAREADLDRGDLIPEGMDTPPIARR